MIKKSNSKFQSTRAGRSLFHRSCSLSLVARYPFSSPFPIPLSRVFKKKLQVKQLIDTSICNLTQVTYLIKVLCIDS